MRLWSDSFENGGPIPAEFAMGGPDGFSVNRNPHLAWDGVPEGVRSFALLCIDPDAPNDISVAGKEGYEIPVDFPRADFIHWAMANIAADTRTIAAGSCCDGITTGGKRQPPGPQGTRQGSNDFTGWFAGDATMRGDYLGYDGPWPPPNDLRTHRYFFRLFALDVEKLELPQRFTAADVFRAMYGHVLTEALTYGTYSLNPGA